jgi:hypothetical protein
MTPTNSPEAQPQEMRFKTTPELTICSEWKDWRILPRVYRDRDGWPKTTVLHWFCFWFQLTTEPDYGGEDERGK